MTITLDLEKLRAAGGPPQQPPFPHQSQAITALNKVFTFRDNQTKGGLLVLPTGAGKTFTSVKWLGDVALPKNVKILWLAHTFHLLDQAHDTFVQYARWVPQRRTLNIRTISSHPAHFRAADVEPGDDIVIMTTPTAIRNLEPAAVDNRGRPVTSPFKAFVEASRNTRLLVVLDEAHHAPAFGCRNLLLRLRQMVPNLYLLGLTATPTYSDETRRGWLKKLFEQEIIYEAKQTDLIAQNILAAPQFIEMNTGREFEVDDQLYHRLVREHKDLPENLINRLADDSARNDYIVQEYVKHKKSYGKTIIFADRWFQCVYLKEKLLAAGVKADAVYSHIDTDPGSAAARNRRTSDDNHRILQQFKRGTGKNALDVLINVRMLTEGTDVPDVKTVFLTRQTTSTILMTQMIGRALRGTKAGGGKNTANIVLFIDKWRQLINWATPASLDGGTEAGKSQVRGYYPLEYISIHLVEALSRQINQGVNVAPQPFSQFIPVGWYQVELVVSTAANGEAEETASFTEFVMVYEQTRPKFEKFLAAIAPTLSDEWASETLSDAVARPQAQSWLAAHFDPAQDDIGHTLELDLVRLARHLAQRGAPPPFHAFDERDQHDLDRLAQTVLDHRWDDFDTDDYLRAEFARPGSLWPTFYKTYDQFKTAFNGTKERKLYEIRMGRTPKPGPPPPPPPRPDRELTEAEKKQIKQRDGNRCLACGASGKGVRLQIDHIRPVNLGGPTTVENSQTLCSVCNREKNINEINFRITTTQLVSPKEFQLFAPNNNSEDIKRTLTRLVNFFYHCQAVSDIRLHQRSNGRYYANWEIELYAGNDPAWLNRHKKALLKFIKKEPEFSHVKSLKIV
ncbi:MAG: DEAD/DEAH box helicase family protein [Anaerolineae bacterium]